METKVQFSVHCKCGTKVMNDELIKKFDRYYCPKCGKETISLNN